MGVRSRKLVAIVLMLTAAGFGPSPSEGQGEASSEEPDVDLSDRVAQLEAQLAEDRREEASSRGQVVYSRVCAACHGRGGGGDGPGAAELDPWPRDFKTGKYRTRSTHSGQPPLRADVEGVVRRGLPGTSMPAFDGALSDQQITDVVTFILTLGPHRPTGREPEALRIPEFPAPDATDLPDGRALYLILGCWKCHGLNGSGRGPSAKDLKSDEGQRIRPRDFRYDPFKGGRSPETVARAALSGLIGTPMPSHAEIMVPPREAIDALVASIPAEARWELDGYRRTAPAAADLATLDDDAWEAMRDANLVSLAHYVLSLDRRSRFVYRLFRQRPEVEARKP
jgi:cytochrome c oxidase cbb3-type subunit 2